MILFVYEFDELDYYNKGIVVGIMTESFQSKNNK